MTRIEEEKLVVARMIELYCRHREGNITLCRECVCLLEYAHTRLSRCPHGHDKPTCRKCTIHCYNPEMRERMRLVMRYSGPRMILYYPIAAVKHLLREFF